VVLGQYIWLSSLSQETFCRANWLPLLDRSDVKVANDIHVVTFGICTYIGGCSADVEIGLCFIDIQHNASRPSLDTTQCLPPLIGYNTMLPGHSVNTTPKLAFHVIPWSQLMSTISQSTLSWFTLQPISCSSDDSHAFLGHTAAKSPEGRISPIGGSGHKMADEGLMQRNRELAEKVRQLQQKNTQLTRQTQMQVGHSNI